MPLSGHGTMQAKVPSGWFLDQWKALHWESETPLLQLAMHQECRLLALKVLGHTFAWQLAGKEPKIATSESALPQGLHDWQDVGRCSRLNCSGSSESLAFHWVSQIPPYK